MRLGSKSDPVRYPVVLRIRLGSSLDLAVFCIHCFRRPGLDMDISKTCIQGCKLHPNLARSYVWLLGSSNNFIIKKAATLTNNQAQQCHIGDADFPAKFICPATPLSIRACITRRVPSDTSFPPNDPRWGTYQTTHKQNCTAILYT